MTPEEQKRQQALALLLRSPAGPMPGKMADNDLQFLKNAEPLGARGAMPGNMSDSDLRLMKEAAPSKKKKKK